MLSLARICLIYVREAPQIPAKRDTICTQTYT